MTGYSRWKDVRAEHVERAGGEEAVAEGKRQLLAEVLGHRLAEIRASRGLTQEQVAERMGVTKGRVSHIEQGAISGQEVLIRYATALGGELHQAIYFDNGDIAAIA
ncbi:helix-turn-helix domain-containing protein [Streptomyces genisteinicus]|uniref:Helix-turn-helix transcriptional regulator n=1 Tax=Streptomyces genisteinicus TaxID=2768068 RepID=A0A7H0HRI7_9ACTN|nr:helix-turn-helix transcriptional regulator [Streptomyces genisteinicus]QNP63153.1 helix-turn-helix transcriptional regulator [Streptomyces genisteinicus]